MWWERSAALTPGWWSRAFASRRVTPSGTSRQERYPWRWGIWKIQFGRRLQTQRRNSIRQAIHGTVIRSTWCSRSEETRTSSGLSSHFDELTTLEAVQSDDLRKLMARFTGWVWGGYGKVQDQMPTRIQQTNPPHFRG